MQKVKKHSGLSKGEKRLALKMVLLDLGMTFIILGAMVFFLLTFIL
jgi:hypothetical protein